MYFTLLTELKDIEKKIIFKTAYAALTNYVFAYEI